MRARCLSDTPRTDTNLVRQTVDASVVAAPCLVTVKEEASADSTGRPWHSTCPECLEYTRMAICDSHFPDLSDIESLPCSSSAPCAEMLVSRASTQSEHQNVSSTFHGNTALATTSSINHRQRELFLFLQHASSTGIKNSLCSYDCMVFQGSFYRQADRWRCPISSNRRNRRVAAPSSLGRYSCSCPHVLYLLVL